MKFGNTSPLNKAKNLPSKAQCAYANMKMIEPTLHYIRDNLIDSELDDMELVADFDLARGHIKCAINRMEKLLRIQEEIIPDSQERKRVCY